MRTSKPRRPSRVGLTGEGRTETVTFLHKMLGQAMRGVETARVQARLMSTMGGKEQLAYWNNCVSCINWLISNASGRVGRPPGTKAKGGNNDS